MFSKILQSRRGFLVEPKSSRTSFEALLSSAALRDAGLLCLAIYRRIDTEEADTADTEPADGEPGEEGADKVVLNI